MPPDAPPDLSVILVALNDRAGLWQSLSSILLQRGLRMETVVMDRGSSDGSLDMLRDLAAANPGHAIRSRCLSGAAPGAARLAGLHLALGRHVLFLTAGDVLAGHDRLDGVLGTGGASMLLAPAPDAGVLRRGPDGLPLPSWPLNHAQAIFRRDFLLDEGFGFAPVIDQCDDAGLVWAALIRARQATPLARPILAATDAAPRSGAQAGGGEKMGLMDASACLAELRAILAALDADRTHQSISPQIEAWASLHVLASLMARWRHLWTADGAAPGAGVDRGQASRIRELITRITANSGPLWSRPCDIDLGARAEDDRISGRLDLLCQGLRTGDTDVLGAIHSGRPIPLARLHAMAGARPGGAAQDYPAATACGLHPARTGPAHTGPAHIDPADTDPADTGRALAHRALAFCRNAPSVHGSGAGGDLPPRILLHVGGMKTGSSALQNWFELNRAALLSQGFLYPATGTFRETGLRSDRNPGHALLVSALLQPGRRSAMLGALHEELAALPLPPHTLLLSAETIVAPGLWMNGQGIGRLTAVLGAGVEVIWLHRAAPGWIDSIHRELMCHPHIPHPSRDALWQTYAAEGLLDSDHVAGILRAAANVTRLHAAAHEEVRKAPGGTAAYVCSVAGINATGFQPLADDSANLSYTAGQAELIALVKRIPGLGAAAREEALRRIALAARTDGGNPQALAILPRLLADCDGFPQAPARGGSIEPAGQSDGFRLFRLGLAGVCLCLPPGQEWQDARLIAPPLPDHEARIVRFRNTTLALVDHATLVQLHRRTGAVTLRLQSAGEETTCRLLLVQDHGCVTAGFPDAPPAPAPPWLRRNPGPAVGDTGCEILILQEDGKGMEPAQAMARIMAASGGPDLPWADASEGGSWRLATPADPATGWRDYFDAAAYLAANPDVAEAGADAATHHAAHGWREARRLSPGLDADRLWSMLGSDADRDADPFAQVVARGTRVILSAGSAGALPRPGAAELPSCGATGPEPCTRPQPLAPDDESLIAVAIDRPFYASAAGRPFTDAREAARHYLSVGWRLGLDPCPDFSSDLYALTHVDVLAAGIAPFAHYLRSGRSEGRRAFTVAEAGRITCAPDNPDESPGTGPQGQAPAKKG